MAIIAKNTPIKIDGYRDGQIKISTATEDYIVSFFDFAFYKLVLENEQGFDVDSWTDEKVPTVETWAKSKEYKGKTPCLTAESAFNEGFGPWFLCPEDLEVDTEAELLAMAEE